MFATERQQAILDRARSEGRVDVVSLAGEFEVTGETIRRDLTSLERRRLLRPTHGGAVPVERLDFEPNLRAMIGAARRTVVLADHTKFAADAFARFGELSDIDVLITDSALDPDLAADVESAGPRVVRA